MSSKLAHVLFVDDDPLLRDAMSRSLRRESFHQHWASSSEEALLMLSKQSIDVIVSDDNMPGLSGAELISGIADYDANIVTVLFSGQPSIGSISLALNRGHLFRVLLKPCPVEVVVTTVHDAIKASHARQRAARLESLARGMAAHLLKKPGLPNDDNWFDSIEILLNQKNNAQ
jgi:two-component system, probable response regulator PhcQ